MKNDKMTISRRAQSLVDYAVILALIAAVVILALNLLGVSVRDVYCKVVKGLGGSGICSHYCFDDLNNGNGWTAMNGTGWQASNGQMCNTGNGESRTFNNCSSQNNLPGDYVVNIDIATLYSGNGYGVYFRLQSNNPTNGYIFQYDPGLNAFVFRKWINGAETGPFASAPAGQYSWFNQPRKIQIRVQGSNFKAYVDDVLWLNANDSTYPSGGAGLRTWDNTRACFDSFAVDPIP